MNLRIRLKNRFLTASVFAGAIFFSPVFAGAPSHEANHGAAGNDWPGLYFGFVPCADCKGVKTTLALNKNKSYVLIRQYVGKSEREHVERGKFDWSNANDKIILTPRNGSEPHYFQVGKNQFIQLDESGNEIMGDSERYTLRRKDVTQQSEPPTQHSGH